jgi:hypothetical protein
MKWIATAFGLLIVSAAFADAPPSHYDMTPLNKADVDLYLSVMRPAAAYVQGAKGDDRTAIDYMKQNHGNPKLPEPPKVPNFNHVPTQAEIAAMQKSMDDYQAKIQKPRQYMTRAATLAGFDEEIARQKHIETQYDAVKNPIESAMAAMTGEGASCGGDDCGPANPTAAQKTLWKKEEDVAKANITFLKPFAPEIMRLRKVLNDVMFTR